MRGGDFIGTPKTTQNEEHGRVLGQDLLGNQITTRKQVWVILSTLSGGVRGRKKVARLGKEGKEKARRWLRRNITGNTGNTGGPAEISW